MANTTMKLDTLASIVVAARTSAITKKMKDEFVFLKDVKRVADAESASDDCIGKKGFVFANGGVVEKELEKGDIVLVCEDALFSTALFHTLGGLSTAERFALGYNIEDVIEENMSQPDSSEESSESQEESEDILIPSREFLLWLGSQHSEITLHNEEFENRGHKFRIEKIPMTTTFKLLIDDDKVALLSKDGDGWNEERDREEEVKNLLNEHERTLVHFKIGE